MADTITASVRLRELYTAELRGALQEELGLANVMQVPRLEKIVVNMGVGDAAQQAKLLDGAVSDLQAIICPLYTSPSPRDQRGSRMPSSA